MPAAVNGRDEVEPEINHKSSAMTARRKTRFVVRRGKIKAPSGVERENLRGLGANNEKVPVPVLVQVLGPINSHFALGVTYLSGRCSPVSRISRMRSRY